VGSGGRASALLLWGRPGGAAGGRGAGCRLERAVRLSRRSASTTVTGPWPPAGNSATLVADRAMRNGH